MQPGVKSILSAALRNVYFLVTLVLLAGFLPALIIKGDLYFNSDWICQQIPFLAEMKRALESGNPFWSWNTYFGADFIGSYAFYTSTSPFAWLLCLLPYDLLLPGSVAMMWVKLLVCAFFTQRYLRKMDFAPIWARAGTLMYVFSSYIFITLIFYHFVEPMIMFPLLLLAVEKYLRRENRSSLLLALAVGATIIINFYFSIGTISVAAMYFLLRLRCFDRRKHLAFGGVICMCVGICLGAVVIVPAALVLMGSNRIASGMGLGFLQLINYEAVRIYSLFVPRLSDYVRYLNFSPVNFASVAAYLPVLGILPAFLFLRKRWRTWLGILTLLLLLLYITPLGAIFVFFTNAHYSRWAYCLVLVLIVASLQYFKEGGKLQGIKIFCILTLALLAVNFAVAYFRFGELFCREGVFIALQIAVVVTNLGCLVFFGRNQRASVLVVAVCISAICFSWAFSAHRYFEWRDYCNANAATELPDYRHLDRGSDIFSHRTEILFHDEPTFVNSLLYSGYPCITQYNSMSPGRLGNLLHTAVSQPGAPYFTPEYNQLSFASLMGVGDYIWVKPSPDAAPLSGAEFDTLSLSSRTKIHDVYEYKHWLPMGFASEHYTLKTQIEPYLLLDSMPDIPKAMISSLVIESSDESKLSPYLSWSAPDFDTPLESVVELARKRGCTEIQADPWGLSASFCLTRPSVLFFSVPSVQGMRAYVNGKETEIFNVNFGLSAVIAPEGEGSVRFEYRPVGLVAGGSISLFGAVALLLMWLWERKRNKVCRHAE